MTDSTILRAFEDAMAARGLVISGGVVADGKIHVCDVAASGAHGKGDGRYLLHPDEPPAGWFQNWRDGLGPEKWRGNGTVRKPSPEEVAVWDARRRQREEGERQEKERVARESQEIWSKSAAPASHPYLTKKGIGGFAKSFRVDGDGKLLVPLWDTDDKLWNLQRIGPDGTKLFPKGGRVKALYSPVGPKLELEGTVIIAEGMATAASIAEATGLPVAAAMFAGNLLPVGKALREKFPKARIVYFADHDAPVPGQKKGIECAIEAAKETGGLVVTPPTEGDDANDLFVREGPAAVRAVIESARPGEAVPEQGPGIEAKSGAGLDPFRPTDLWNAQSFVHLHKDKVRYCDRMGGWYHYGGKRWTRAEGGEIERLAKETVRHLYEMAALEPDDARRQAIAKHAAKTEAAGKLDAILELAKTEEGIIVPPDAFDADPWLFNTQTGTLDLRTGGVRPHRPEDMITNISPAEWRGTDLGAPLFGRFLSEAMDGDREKIDFLQRAAGYTLSGDMREQVFMFLHGPEAAGKGTFIRAMADVIGAYAQSTEIETFLTARRETVRNDIASLVGARLVTASEPEDGQSFDEGLIKILTGQDKTKARFLFREAFEFSATFKIWLQGNHRPHIRSTGGAMWRRLLIVPFEKTVPEGKRDKTLGDKLRTPEERAGILAWMVRGCLEWQRTGLKPPEKVRAAVAEYRAAEDRIAPFLEDCCEVHPSGAVPAAQLYARYKAWAESNCERPLSKRSFGMRLSEKGFEPDRTGRARKWVGLVLTTGREPGVDDDA